MQAATIRQLATAIGIVAWGLLLIFAARENRITVLNFRWEGKQPQVRKVATRATFALGVGAVAFGVLVALGALLL